MKLAGGCLCGSVRFVAEADPQFQVKCYCTDCRRLSGAAHVGWMGLEADKVSVEGEVTGFPSLADSGNQVQRDFCPRCGVGLFGHNSAMPGMIFIRASALDEPEGFSPQMAIFASRAPTWDKPPEGLPAFERFPAQG